MTNVQGRVETRLAGRQNGQKLLWSNETEQALLGACLLDATAVTKATGIIRDADVFYSERHRVLLQAMQALVSRGDTVDPVTVRDELLQRGDLDRAGGMEYIATLIDTVPTAGHAETYARKICEYAEQRAVLAHAHQLVELASDASTPLDVLRAKMADAAAKLPTSRGTGLSCFSDREILSLPDPAWAIDAFLPLGGLIELVGRWGAGKSFLLLDWSMHIAAGMPWQGRKVQRGPVLYVFAEGSMKARVAAWRAAHGVADDNTIGVRFGAGVVNFLSDDAVGAFIGDINAERLGPSPVMIVFETLTRMTPACARCYGQDGSEWRAFRSQIRREQ